VQIASTDFAAQARNAAVAAGQGIQSGAKGAADGFNKFIEGQDEGASAAASRKKVEPERKDFWDSFGVSKDEDKPSNIGTGVLKKTTSNTGSGAKRSKDDGWGEDW
jgi:ADP-ribosylation factor GTPase-activating protein 1